MAEQRYFDYEVFDNRSNKVGTVEAVWLDDATNRPEFLGVKTGWILGKIHVVPITGATIDEATRRVNLQWDEQRVKDAPSFDVDERITPEQEQRIYSHFGVSPSLPGLGGMAGAGIGSSGMGGGVGSGMGRPGTSPGVGTSGTSGTLGSEGREGGTTRILRHERHSVHLEPAQRRGSLEEERERERQRRGY
jgi:sporulation protein YlmC with PRC-barrel domain